MVQFMEAAKRAIATVLSCITTCDEEACDAKVSDVNFYLWNGSVMFDMMSLSNDETERNNFFCTNLRKLQSFDLFDF